MSEKRKQNKRKSNESREEQQSKRLGREMRNWPDKTDVLGSYTGMAEGSQMPVQDVDDL